MKVDFKPYIAKSFASPAEKRSGTDVSKVNNVNMDIIHPKNVAAVLTFTGNPTKNKDMILSVAPEYSKDFLGCYYVGGLGNVAGEAASAFKTKGRFDIRTILPYYSPNNDNGKIQVVFPIEGKYEIIEKGKPTGKFKDKYGFKEVDADYQLQKGEHFVVHDLVADGKKPWGTPYRILEKTSVSGNVDVIDKDLSTRPLPYTLFKVQDGQMKEGTPPIYVMHTPDIAKFKGAYGSGIQAYSGDIFEDLIYSDWCKCIVDAMPKMNTDEFGNFNPQSYWLHDRQAFSLMPIATDKSAAGNEYWRGFQMHGTYHNPGRSYQGPYDDPISFYRMVATKEDLEELQKANPENFKYLQRCAERLRDLKKASPTNQLPADDQEKVRKILDPIIGRYKDEFATSSTEPVTYNMCMMPVVNKQTNPNNASLGTVSRYFAHEMKNPETPEIAYGLTSILAQTETVDIVNGSTPANMNLNVRGSLGKGDIAKSINGYTPIYDKGKEIGKTKEGESICEYKFPDIDEIFRRKQANKKWLIDGIAGHLDPDNPKNADVKFFFSEKDLAERPGTSILGKFSEYKDGDVLIAGWGRPDKQKGLPISLEGFIKFLQDPNIPSETKEKTKLILSAGPWPKVEDKAKGKSIENPEWTSIQEKMKTIQEIDGGKYAGNCCYINGFFTNRMVSCADYAYFTSEFEPCGITPLESYTAATPVLSHATGGAPDFVFPYETGKEVTTETGFLTKHAFKVKPEVIGKEAGLSGDALYLARVDALGKEDADMISQAVDLFTKDKEGYKRMCKNALDLPIDWDNNVKFNKGKSALQLYSDAWHINGGINTEPLKRMNGLPTTENIAATASKAAKSNKHLGLIIGGAAAGVAAISGVAIHFARKKKAQQPTSKSDAKLNQTKLQAQKQEAAKSNASTQKAFSKLA